MNMIQKWQKSILMCLVLTITIVLASCSSSSTMPSDVKDKKLWSGGQSAYQILKTATSGKSFKRLNSKDEDVLINFINTYDAEQTGLSRTESKIAYYVGSAYENYRLNLDTSASNMDRMNGGISAKNNVNDLRVIFEKEEPVDENKIGTNEG